MVLYGFEVSASSGAKLDIFAGAAPLVLAWISRDTKSCVHTFFVHFFFLYKKPFVQIRYDLAGLTSHLVSVHKVL